MAAPREQGRASRRLGWLLRDPSSGRVAVVQWPNAALLTFLAARGVGWLLGPEGTASRILGWIGTAALLWWSIDELARGLSPFRRILGAVVLTALGVGVLRAVGT